VTVDQFTAFVNDTGYQTDAESDGYSPGLQITNDHLDRSVANALPDCSWRKPSFKQTGDHPVVQISWNDATAFCAWLSKKTGKTVTLPTEAQWEYACRAGTTTAFSWGDNPDDGKGFANCADQSLRKLFPADPPEAFFTWDDGFDVTSPVASFKPNVFGLYDMTGNVFQWCQDWYGPYDTGPVTDPAGPANGAARVVRGGTWNNEPRVSRSAFRYSARPNHRNVDYGLRIVLLPG
jgi:formylglycine-generating enzyme required for sulfatase activity